MIPKGKRQVATVAVFFRPGAKADARVRPGLELGPRPPAGRGPAVPCQIPPLGPARVAQRPLLVAVPALLSSHSKKEKKKSHVWRDPAVLVKRNKNGRVTSLFLGQHFFLN